MSILTNFDDNTYEMVYKSHNSFVLGAFMFSPLDIDSIVEVGSSVAEDLGEFGRFQLKIYILKIANFDKFWRKYVGNGV